jgi:hypothetical protein
VTWHDVRILIDLAFGVALSGLVLAALGRNLDTLVKYLTGSEPMSGKRYGKPHSTRLAEPFEFELMAALDDEDEVHEFTAVRQVDKLLGAQFTSFSDEEAHKSVNLLVKLIAKTLNDKDGTPATWAPVQLPPKSPGHAGEFIDAEPPKFRGPDGELYEMEHADKFAAFEAGSSRRRFLALVGDQERTVQAEDLTAIVKDLIAVSTGRPTGASSPSSA